MSSFWVVDTSSRKRFTDDVLLLVRAGVGVEARADVKVDVRAGVGVDVRAGVEVDGLRCAGVDDLGYRHGDVEGARRLSSNRACFDVDGPSLAILYCSGITL